MFALIFKGMDGFRPDIVVLTFYPKCLTEIVAPRGIPSEPPFSISPPHFLALFGSLIEESLRA